MPSGTTINKTNLGGFIVNFCSDIDTTFFKVNQYYVEFRSDVNTTFF